MSEIFFAGPLGRIEGRYHVSKDRNAPVALVLHPDPMQGGTMNNKVSYTMFKAFVETSFTVLRINFPGVGKSEGTRANGEDEFRVASASLDWLRHNNPEASHYWVGGFSFGSYIAMQLVTRRPEIEGFVAIAPPTPTYDFSFSVPCPLPGLVISGEKDDIAPLDKVSKLVNDWSRRKDCIISHHTIPEAGHFFDNSLEEVLSVTVDYINTSLAMRIAKPVRKKRRRRKKRDRGYDNLED